MPKNGETMGDKTVFETMRMNFKTPSRMGKLEIKPSPLEEFHKADRKPILMNTDPAYVINPYYATLFDDDGLDAPEWHMVQLQKQMLVTT
ncbi:hypothetical protein L3Y34_011173 [Caenorhabditis briggsae]|uniref:Uncharacterized protein n=1 Tax=Caenorhabditis briggsae TaxID=6238 RepID=A0AAE8ZQP9_CAEBR|nr:hypothetical protein L3Y34_011173 [Caenorhabditis briggsae]